MSTITKVDYVLILAAGKGTRMGEVGKILPKLLWPVFEKKLIDLQFSYACELAPRAKIYTNIYNYSESLTDYLSSTPYKNELNILKEEEKLDIGGAIHNFASSVNYDGTLLILNGDQFLSLGHDVIDNALVDLKDNDSVLFSFDVNSSDGYNALDTENELLKGIIPNSELRKNTNIKTYTGTSLIKLSSLENTKGESKFFDSVANYKTKSVKISNLDELEYWDFGTVKRYYESINNVLTNTKSWFYQFLLKNDALDLKKINQSNYNSKSGINLSSAPGIECGKTICLDEELENLDLSKSGILYKGVYSGF